MKIVIQREDGLIKVKKPVMQRLSPRPDPHRMMRTMKTVKDTPENYKDILRWAEVVGYEVEEG